MHKEVRHLSLAHEEQTSPIVNGSKNRVRDKKNEKNSNVYARTRRGSRETSSIDRWFLGELRTRIVSLSIPACVCHMCLTPPRAHSCSLSLPQVTFEEKRANVYDVAPKIRIMGSGFDTLDASTFKMSFAPKLTVDEDYALEISSSTLMVLTLKPNKK